MDFIILFLDILHSTFPLKQRFGWEIDQGWEFDKLISSWGRCQLLIDKILVLQLPVEHPSTFSERLYVQVQVLPLDNETGLCL